MRGFTWLPAICRGILAAGVLTTTAHAQAADDPFPRARPEDIGMSSTRLRSAMDTIRSLVRRDVIRGGVLIVIRDGKLVLHDTAGWNDMERGLRMQPDQIVTMRSMTKPLIGTATLMLMEEGKLKIDDRVAKYLPAFDNAKSRDITIAQLLSHTSGLRGEIYNDQDGSGTGFRTLREAADSVGRLGPETPPGTAYWYSDPGNEHARRRDRRGLWDVVRGVHPATNPRSSRHARLVFDAAECVESEAGAILRHVSQGRQQVGALLGPHDAARGPLLPGVGRSVREWPRLRALPQDVAGSRSLRLEATARFRVRRARTPTIRSSRRRAGQAEGARQLLRVHLDGVH